MPEETTPPPETFTGVQKGDYFTIMAGIKHAKYLGESKVEFSRLFDEVVVDTITVQLKLNSVVHKSMATESKTYFSWQNQTNQ